jgi:hypothetical protein
MNKAQFIAALAPHFGDSKKEAARAVDVVFDTIVRNISKGEDVMINDFGKFKKVDHVRVVTLSLVKQFKSRQARKFVSCQQRR